MKYLVLAFLAVGCGGPDNFQYEPTEIIMSDHCDATRYHSKIQTQMHTLNCKAVDEDFQLAFEYARFYNMADLVTLEKLFNSDFEVTYLTTDDIDQTGAIIQLTANGSNLMKQITQRLNIQADKAILSYRCDSKPMTVFLIGKHPLSVPGPDTTGC